MLFLSKLIKPHFTKQKKNKITKKSKSAKLRKENNTMFRQSQSGWCDILHGFLITSSLKF